jgi:hypothetical protein
MADSGHIQLHDSRKGDALMSTDTAADGQVIATARRREQRCKRLPSVTIRQGTR